MSKIFTYEDHIGAGIHQIVSPDEMLIIRQAYNEVCMDLNIHPSATELRDTLALALLHRAKASIIIADLYAAGLHSMGIY